MVLKTKKFFIDTQYFVQKNLNLKLVQFRRLLELCRENELDFFMTSVVQKEIENKIRESMTNVFSDYRNFKRKAEELLGNSDKYKSLFSEITESEIQEKVIGDFSGFYQECQVNFIDSSKIDTEKLLNLYFEGLPPFSSKKKDEFPDVISLLSLESCLKEGELMYVISGDKDLKNYCESSNKLIYLDSLENLIDKYEEHIEELLPVKLREYIKANSEEFTNLVIRYIDNVEMINDSTWEDSEVIQRDIISIDDFEINIIDTSDQECTVILNTSVLFMVKVEGPDYINSIYDKESDMRYFFSHSTREDEVSFKLSCEFILNYKFLNDCLENIELQLIDIPEASYFYINIEEENGWPYK